jgi:hypothetical protein
MSRKDFEAIAQAIKAHVTPENEDALYRVADQIAEHCIDCNDLFDYSRFMTACGVTE